MKASYPIWKVSRVWLKTPRPALGIIDCFTSTRFIDSSIDKNLGGWPAKSSKLLLQWVYKIYTCPVFRLSKKFGFQTLLPRFGNKCPKTGLPGIRFLNKSSFCTITVLFILVSGQIILIKWWSNYQACGDVVGLIRVPKWVVLLVPDIGKISFTIRLVRNLKFIFLIGYLSPRKTWYPQVAWVTGSCKLFNWA